MMSCVQFQKSNSWSFRTGILVGGWRLAVRVRGTKKEWNTTENRHFTLAYMRGEN